MSVSFYGEITINVEDICQSLDTDKVAALILELDAGMADAEFTEELIKRLIKSLVAEFKDSPEDRKELIKSINGAFQNV